MRDALVGLLKPVIGDDVSVENLRILTGGASRATWSFDAVTADGRRPLILRTGDDSDDVHAGMQAEATAQRLAAAAGAPVPHVLLADDAPDVLGTAYLICDFIEGETIARRINRSLDTKPPHARLELLRQCAAALAAIHRSDISGLDHSDDQLQSWRAQLDDMGDTTATFEYAFRWLAANRPTTSVDVLVHGDFRMGNVIVDDGRLAAVLDWELVHVGSPYEDLAWFCTKAWRFGAPPSHAAAGLGSIEDFLAAYEHEAGWSVDREQLHWWLVRATLCWGVICRYQAERHLSGQTRSVELAAIGRRVCETEWDLLDLFEGVRS